MAQRLHKLQNGWRVEALTEVARFIGGSQPPKSQFSYTFKEGFVRLIQIRDYKSDMHKVFVDKNSTKKFCSIDDVMIGRYGPPVFQILRGLEGAYNVALMKAVPDENILTKDFLHIFLQSPAVQNYIVGLSQRAAGQSGVNKRALENYQIPLPPLDEQKRIVAKLNALFVRLDTAINHLQDNLKLSNNLFASVLEEAFNSGHIEMSIGDVALLVSGQHLKKADYTENKTPKSIPYLTGPAEFGDTSPDPSRWAMIKRSVAIAGDTLITVKGSGVGKVNKMVASEIAISRQLMAVRPKGQIDNNYLYMFFQARQQAFADKKTGAAIPGIRRQDVLEQMISVPPLEEQHRIVSYLDKLSKRTRAIETASEEKLYDLTTLKASLLDSAFRGQL